jgi:cytoskeletal protein RodZ
MSDTNQSLTSPDLWIRLIYMLIFWLLSFIARVVIGIVAFIQFFVVLFSGETNKNLKDLGEGIASWTQQNYRFLCFASDQKPYPFQDWPVPTSDQSQTAQSEAPETASENAAPEADVPVVTDSVTENDDESGGSEDDKKDK